MVIGRLTLLVIVLNQIGNELVEIGKTEETPMLTADQAAAVAVYLIAHTPGAADELNHRHVSAPQMSCEALGHAAETARGAPPLPSRRCYRDGTMRAVSVAAQSGPN